jgi:hypothetical protein
MRSPSGIAAMPSLVRARGRYSSRTKRVKSRMAGNTVTARSFS